MRQSLRDAALTPDAPDSATPTADTQVAASVLTAFMMGRLQRFARSGFRRLPTEALDAALLRML